MRSAVLAQRYTLAFNGMFSGNASAPPSTCGAVLRFSTGGFRVESYFQRKT